MDVDQQAVLGLTEYSKKMVERLDHYRKALAWIFENRKCTGHPATGGACGARIEDKCAYCITKHLLEFKELSDRRT